MIRKWVSGCTLVVALELLPVVLTIGWISSSIVVDPSQPGWPHATDLHTFWAATKTALHGGNPYPRPHDVVQWTTQSQQSFVYPPAALALMVPLTYVTYHTAMLVFLPLLALAMVAGLRLLGVRDRHCYGALFLWPATQTSIGIGTLSPLLFLGLAAAWRWRDRRVVAALATAFVVTAKLFLWPVLVWMWFTGRRASALVAVATGIAASAVAWALIDFAGFRSYPALLRALSAAEARHSLSLVGLVGGGLAVPFAALAGAAVVGVVSTRGAAIAVALLISPIVWLHYLVLLALPLALTRPRFGAIWLVPAVAWVTTGSPYGGNWRTVLATALVVIVWASASGMRLPANRSTPLRALSRA